MALKLALFFTVFLSSASAFFALASPQIAAAVTSPINPTTTLPQPQQQQSSDPSSLYEYLKSNDDFSEFVKSIEQFRFISGLLKDSDQPVTLFAPTNAAIRRWRQRTGAAPDAPLTDELVKNHIPGSGYDFDALRKIAQDVRPVDRKITSLLNNYILWLSEVGGDVFLVNNARLVGRNETAVINRHTYLYTIDDVLAPAGKLSVTASKFMDKKDGYPQLQFSRLQSYIDKYRLQTTFQGEPSAVYTYFLPDDEAFSGINDNQITEQEILAHVVKNRVLFLNTIYADENDADGYRPMAFGNDTAKGVVSTLPGGFQLYVNALAPDFIDSTEPPQAYSFVSFNKQSTASAPAATVAAASGTILFPGRVYARILHANIPIDNGVVHVIDKPFVLVRESVGDIIGAPALFGNVWRDLAQKPNNKAIVLGVGQQGITFFSPTNEALSSLPPAKRQELYERTAEIFGLHLLNERLMLSDITNNTVRQLPNGKTLTFKIVNDYSNGNVRQMYYVMGAGVTARIVQPDVAATNGIVHVIDQVLGLPSPNIMDVMRNDSQQLSQTYDYLTHTGMVYRLQQQQQNFTVFAPSNRAWASVDAGVRQRLLNDLPTLVRVLERHVIPQYRIDSADAVSTTPTDRQFFTFNGLLTLVPNDSSDALGGVQWQNVEARIVDAELIGANGVIHIIDRVLLNDNDTAQLPATSQPNVVGGGRENAGKLDGSSTRYNSATTIKCCAFSSIVVGAMLMVLSMLV